MTGQQRQVYAPIRAHLPARPRPIRMGDWVTLRGCIGPKRVMSIEGTAALLQHQTGYRAGWWPMSAMRRVQPLKFTAQD